MTSFTRDARIEYTATVSVLGGAVALPFLYRIFESVILVISLSTDAFAASLAYGTGKIKIPTASVVAISFVCSGMLALSMLAGSLVSNLVSPQLTRWFCFAMLLTIGMVRLFDQYIKNHIRKKSQINLNFSAHNLNFFLTIYADAETADIDCSKTLSVKEATALAVALSLDGLAVGFGAAISGAGILLPVIISLTLTFIAVKVGCTLGERLKTLLPFDLSYLSSLLLILLAFLRL